MLHIAQVSDLHISETDKPYYDVDVRQNFLAVLANIKTQSPDLMVLSGDLAAEAGERGAYLWLHDVLADLPFPYYLMMGNHDCLTTLSHVFPDYQQHIQQDKLYYRVDFPYKNQSLPLLFMDSGANQLSTIQLDWLQRQNQHLQQQNQQGLLFIHHPPCLAGARFMDGQYPLTNWQQSWAVLKTLPALQHIFCGHYHTEKTLCFDNKMVYLTPSTMVQIDTHRVDFAVDHHYAGWRWINWDGQQLHSHCKYIFQQ